jgi:flagellin-specific chaperone FliS
MTMHMMTEYRAGMFDGETSLGWLRPGWRGLKLYVRKAKAAIGTGDIMQKAEMINRADQLLVLMAGLLDTGAGTTLGPALLRIYQAIGAMLLRANLDNDIVALDNIETALAALERDMFQTNNEAMAA